MTGTAKSVNLWIRRVGWLVAIWIASVIALGIVASSIRSLMTLCGMKS